MNPNLIGEPESPTKKRVILVAYHFPPLAGSSGIQRTLRFAQHLPKFGWEPLVLTVHPRAYERTSRDLAADLSADVVVRRAFALDTARHLALRGRYIGALARPDRWVSWRFDGVRQGMRMIREFKPRAIWSTYPIATAHVIGAELHRRSGLPWLADFRDPMAQDGYPADSKTWQNYKEIESRTLGHSALSVFTTPSAAAEYRNRYPSVAARVRVLENGYDEEAFVAANDLHKNEPLVPGAVTLLHSGIVYPSERDPTQLMAALRRMHDAGQIVPGKLRVRFRAPIAEALIRQLADAHNVAGYIEIAPPLAYREALSEMLRADGLLVMQASNCNAQIPAKLYEYLRSGRPILGLTDPAGDTAGALRSVGVSAIARLDSVSEICDLVVRFLDRIHPTLRVTGEPTLVMQASREERTRVLAGWLSEITGGNQSKMARPSDL